MNEQSSEQGPSKDAGRWTRILLEALLVAIVGSAFAFAANNFSPRGLTLTRNYFPGNTNKLAAAPVLPLMAGIRQKGLQWIDGAKAAELFKDPRFSQKQIVFIDARNSDQFQQGHIPGAHELDPYQPEKYLSEMIPVCQEAEEVVLYCNGGDCEDSQFAAVLLREAGIPNQKLFVFIGGLPEWTRLGMPVEKGSGNESMK